MMKATMLLLAALAVAPAAGAGESYVGAVKVTPRADAGVEVTLDENDDGVVDSVFLILTRTPSTVRLSSASALVTVDATSLRILPNDSFPSRAIVAHIGKGTPARTPAGWTTIKNVIGLTHTTGAAAQTPAAVRTPNAAELATDDEETKAFLASPDVQSVLGPQENVVRFPDPPPPDPGDDTPGGGWGATSCSRSCANGSCAAICNWPYRARCACAPGTQLPICGCSGS